MRPDAAEGNAAETPAEWDDLAVRLPSDVDEVDGLVRGRHRDRRVPLLSVPASLRSSELRVGVRAVRGLLVLVVVAAVVLGGRWLWTIQRTAVASPADRILVGSVETAQGEQPSQGGASTEGGAVTPGTAAPPGGGEKATQGPEEEAGATDLVVHVAGEVEEPGVVEVPPGSRVVDAIRAAGGLTPHADQSTLNLARQLVDGERVWVGRPGETPPAAAGPVGSVGGAGPGGAGDPAGAGTPLDLNAATQADLEELPGIGPVTAGHILSWREEHGRFSSVDELLEVSGIGERTLAQLEPLVAVGG